MVTSLKAGGNYVVYTGRAQLASAAFASIISYLTGTIYYWNSVTGVYEQVITTTTMVPYGVYWIEVTQNCTWTYGAEATAPSSVQLHSGTNLVAYSGPSQPVEDALASILDYFTGALYFDNTTKYWMSVLSGYTMVPNTPYSIGVDRDCVWVFENGAGDEDSMIYSSIAITAPDTAEQGAVVPMSTVVTNITANSLKFRIDLYAVRDIYAVPASEERIGSLEVVIGGGQSQTVSGSFIMPAWDAIVLVMVYLFINYWDFDNYASMAVSLIVPGIPTGIITRTEIAVDSVQTVPPVSGVEVDDDFLLHVWAKNTTTESMKMGLRYVITSPTGTTTERRVDELWPYTGAGQIHHFVEGPAGPEAMFDIDEPGAWLLSLYLYGDDILIDMADMVMFTAVGEPPDDPIVPLGELVSVEIMVMV